MRFLGMWPASPEPAGLLLVALVLAGNALPTPSRAAPADNAATVKRALPASATKDNWYQEESDETVSGSIARPGPTRLLPEILRDPSRSRTAYLKALQQALMVYGDHHAIPTEDVHEMSVKFHRDPADIARDLVHVHQGGTDVSSTRPPEPPPPEPEAAPELVAPIEVPADELVDAPLLEPAYERLLEETMEKYGGREQVPETSVRWIAKRWSRAEDQVQRDMRQVEEGPENVLGYQPATPSPGAGEALPVVSARRGAAPDHPGRRGSRP